MHSAEKQEGVPLWYFEREIGIFLKIHKCQIVICYCRILGFLRGAKRMTRAKALPLKSSTSLFPLLVCCVTSTVKRLACDPTLGSSGLDCKSITKLHVSSFLLLSDDLARFKLNQAAQLKLLKCLICPRLYGCENQSLETCATLSVKSNRLCKQEDSEASQAVALGYFQK